jgi:hypothetical protein
MSIGRYATVAICAVLSWPLGTDSRGENTDSAAAPRPPDGGSRPTRVDLGPQLPKLDDTAKDLHALSSFLRSGRKSPPPRPASVRPDQQLVSWSNVSKRVFPLALLYGGGAKNDSETQAAVDASGQLLSWASVGKEISLLALMYGGGRKIDAEVLGSAGGSDVGPKATAKATGNARGFTPPLGDGMTRDILSDSDEEGQWIASWSDDRRHGVVPHIHFRRRDTTDLGDPGKADGDTANTPPEDSTPDAQGAKVKLAFKAHAGYIISSQFEPSTAKSFAVITDQAQLDQFLAVATVLDPKSLLDARSQRIPQDVFKSRIVLAVIRNPDMAWRYSVDKVTVEQGVVQLHYATKAKENVTVTFAFARPLIVSIPKGDYAAVQFVENQRVIMTVGLREAETRRNRAMKTSLTLPSIGSRSAGSGHRP